MISTPYSVLYDSVLSKVKDYDFLSLSQSDVYSIMFDYIRPAIVKFKSCKQDLKNRDDLIGQFNIELSDSEIEILSDYMVVVYIDANYIRVPAAMKQQLSSKDFNTFSPSALLEKVTAVRNKYMQEAKQMMIDYSYENSKLFESVKK